MLRLNEKKIVKFCLLISINTLKMNRIITITVSSNITIVNPLQTLNAQGNNIRRMMMQIQSINRTYDS